jgi:hypothetical protein
MFVMSSEPLAPPGSLPKLRAFGDECIVSSLRGLVSCLNQSLPIAPVEPPSISVLPDFREVGRVYAPSNLTAASLSIRWLAPSVPRGFPATFILSESPGGYCAATAALKALASVVRIEAVLLPPWRPTRNAAEPIAATPVQHLLPLDYEPSIIHGDVRIHALMPADRPVGSRIVVLRASVLGSDVPLGKEPLQVTSRDFHHYRSVGSHHVIPAAQCGNVHSLMCALVGGATTEEVDDVSGLDRT